MSHPDPLFSDAAAAITTQQRWQQLLREELASPFCAAGESLAPFLNSGELARGREAARRVKAAVEGSERS